MCDAQMTSDPAAGPEEGKKSSASSPIHELPPPPSSPSPIQPKMDALSSFQQADPMSLARLRLLSAYRLSSQKSASIPDNRWTLPTLNEIEEYKVRWEDHGNNIIQQVARMEQDPASADVTVATKGFTMPAHRIVLAAASKFFSSVLQRVPPGQHPVIVVRDADPKHLKFVVNFCYTGTVTIPAKDVQQVAKLADDLEVYALRVSCQVAGNEETATALPPPMSALRNRLYRPQSPKWFTFSPIQKLSPTNLSSLPQQNHEDHSAKRHNSYTSYHEVQGRKRFKGNPIPVGKEGELSPPATYTTSPTLPGSAPPNVPSTSFFGKSHPSPPNSAPPQNLSASSHLSHLGTAANPVVKQEEAPLNLVSPSQILDPEAPLSLTPNHRSETSSPLEKKELPSPTTPMPVPSTPNSLALALTEPLTPSTPMTPNTPSLFNGDSSGTNRMGLGCNASGCSTGSRVLLWRFLLDLLHNPHYSPIYIRWLDRAAGIFRIMESDMVAQLWGMARKNSNMNYEKMSRGMRTYYKRGILFHIDGTKLIYKFNTSDPEIQQRMRYYDLTLKTIENDIKSEEQQPSSSLSSSPTLPSHSSVANLPPLPSLSGSPSAVTSSSASAAIDSLYSPYFRDFPQIPSGILYEPYITSFLSKATQRELF